MINRAAILLKYKSPAVQWINESDPVNDDPGISIDSVNEDRLVYLIRHQDADNPNILKEWIRLNYETLFESELNGWYTNESLWPKKRDLDLFYKWFEIECHSVIEDTVGLPIEDEKI